MRIPLVFGFLQFGQVLGIELSTLELSLGEEFTDPLM
jgi:hypothetical protein